MPRMVRSVTFFLVLSYLSTAAQSVTPPLDDHSSFGSTRAILSLHTPRETAMMEEVSMVSAAASSTWLASEYERMLDESPLVTKSTTAAIVSLVGDVLAQVCLHYFGANVLSIDWERAASVSAEGLFVSGPLLHLAYDWMDKNVSFMSDQNLDGETKPSPRSTVLQSILQVTLDIFVMDSIFAMTLMVFSALLQRRSLRQIYNEIKSESMSAVLAAWGSSLFLSPLQFCNFHFVPVQYRVLITNIQDVLWNAVVSYTAHRHRVPISKEKSG